MDAKGNSLGLVSLIVGLVSVALVGIGIIPGIMAVTLGIIALKEKENRKQDKIFSIVGIVTGILPILIILLAVLLWGPVRSF